MSASKPSEYSDSVSVSDSVSNPASDFASDSSSELLAPAGTLISLLAAIQNGADAVYMGASRFSARAYAGNFSDCELAAGIDYAHAFGKKVYVTLNTLYRDDELDDVMLLFDELYRHGVDSVIVQDLGLLARVADQYPGFAVHASTQMTVHNSYHAAFLQKKGVSRVVPARENSIPELIEIKKTGVEVETFVHGALCICYSGQCLFSSLVGSRSGNRGKCAQPCRKRYVFLVGGNPVSTDGQYLISPKDLNASENISALIQAGVDSFKIEGRMKKPEYVAGVVSVYRHLIDRIISNDSSSQKVPTRIEKEKLKKLFNRDFTDGYFLKNPGNELMSRKLPYNKGILIGKIVSVDRRKFNITVLLTSDLSAHDGISIGDIGKNMNSTEDPRIGFTVKKMYVGRSICSKAASGDSVEIPLPQLGAGEKLLFPSIGDSVYKTFDFELQKEISKTFPAATVSEEERDVFIEQTVSDAYSQAALPASLPASLSVSSSVSPSDSSPVASSNSLSDSLALYSSSTVFPISEMIEKLSPAESVQITVSFNCQIEAGKPIQITVSDSEGCQVTVQSDYIIETAQKNPFSENQARDLLLKLGGTIYRVHSVDISIVGDCFVPVGEFKTVRNKALQALLNERIISQRRQSPVGAVFSNNGIEKTDVIAGDVLPAQVSVCVYSEDELFAALNAGADRVYIGGDIFKDPLTQIEYGITVDMIPNIFDKLSASDKEKIFFKTPFITKETDFESLNQNLIRLKEIGISGISASNIGVYEFIRSNPVYSGFFRIATDSAFNLFNSDAASLFLKDGVSSVLLSPELSISEIEQLIRSSVLEHEGILPPVECIVHGRQRLMVTEHPLLQSLLKDMKQKDIKQKDMKSASESAGSDNKTLPFFEYAIKDSKNYTFPVLVDAVGRNYVFNSRELNAFDLLPRLLEANVTFFRIDGIGHTPDEIGALVRHYKNGLSNSNDVPKNNSNDGAEFTKGNFLRSVD
ncbi:DUF3656 domain-containing U32 family peptidase [Methanimicrococcus blatticola]|uniref:Putative protease n=1 Tax=Methanimicrococcus blatticola TaxID=91560 RepID=A0A484F5T6_9EURY|nr:U32 family peptidase [Methanimicrococcus blatticola]MBZ3935279.1 DUF3656 domain-containing protein [Methanimicrococcus blatticola]MCC2508623.1 U32 family peptidase [Methanimicrococcus blatticola]TDQ67928.1 putative protease [Methanimicrococcus blatticola]